MNIIVFLIIWYLSGLVGSIILLSIAYFRDNSTITIRDLLEGSIIAVCGVWWLLFCFVKLWKRVMGKYKFLLDIEIFKNRRNK